MAKSGLLDTIMIRYNAAHGGADAADVLVN